MSTTDSNSDTALDRECPLIDGRREIQIIKARTSDVGGIPVARLLPSRKRRLIGAWCFLDHAGPSQFANDEQSLHVGPHPHTCLQTFTWMIDGDLIHRDSLGYEQRIRPGQVNLMTAGKGISHTEDSPPGEKVLHAAQLWIALPYEHRNTAPRFDHYPELPQFECGQLHCTLLVGQHSGHEAPTLTFSPLLGMDLVWTGAGTDTDTGANTQTIELRPDFEYGIVALEGAMHIDGELLETDELAYLGIKRNSVEVQTSGTGRALLIGGEPLDEGIIIWWNFVGHSRDDVEQAQIDWQQQSERFGTVVNAKGKRLEPPAIPWRRQ